MDSEEKPPAFWQTLPGVLTGIAAVITALTGLTVALQQAGVFEFAGGDQPSAKIKAIADADLIAGIWSGNATDANGVSFDVIVDIGKACGIGQKCGSISVSHVPCKGELSLKAILQDSYEFSVDNFTQASSPSCSSGAGEHFRLLPDGTLLYTTTYDPKARGVLNKING